MKYPIPFLEFNDPRGLDLAEFNTLRLGVGWGKRLQRGDRVLLAHGHQIVGSALVRLVVTGTLKTVVGAYAPGNHIEQALRAEQGDGYVASDAAARRLDSMRKNYGPRTFDKARSATVIVLKRRL